MRVAVKVSESSTSLSSVMATLNCAEMVSFAIETSCAVEAKSTPPPVAVTAAKATGTARAAQCSELSDIPKVTEGSPSVT